MLMKILKSKGPQAFQEEISPWNWLVQKDTELQAIDKHMSMGIQHKTQSELLLKEATILQHLQHQ